MSIREQRQRWSDLAPDPLKTTLGSPCWSCGKWYLKRVATWNLSAPLTWNCRTCEVGWTEIGKFSTGS